jgi:hypothetical protein
MPKIKNKIKINVKPQAIDLAKNVKNKLIYYARNGSSFC